MIGRRTLNNSLEIEPSDLKFKMDSDENLYILDVRTPEEYEAWRFSYDKHLEPSLVPLDRLSVDESIRDIPKDKEVITVCSHGVRSRMAAEYLTQLGYNAKSIKGGMVAWNKVNDFALVPCQLDPNLKIWQIRRISKGCMAYLIAHVNDAVIVDPPCSSVPSLVQIAQDGNLRIRAVIETHRHADHVSASITLAKETGATVYLSSLEEYDISEPRASALDLKFINEGNKIDVSNKLSLDVMHTPGHTPGSMALRLETFPDEGSSNKEQIFLFCGDTLFVDGIGRPDLHDRVEEFSRALFLTYKRLSSLPDETVVLPSHYGKSMKHNDPIFSTLRRIKDYVKAFRMNENELVSYVDSSVPPQPINYKRILRLNKDLQLCNDLYLDDLEAGPNSCGIQS